MTKSLNNVHEATLKVVRNNTEKKHKRRSRLAENEAETSWRFHTSNNFSISTYEKETRRKYVDKKYDRIWRLRTFNNWAKSYIMLKGVPNESLKPRSIIGLDLGCSRGRDLKKWHHCNIDHLYLVENDPSEMQECL